MIHITSTSVPCSSGCDGAPLLPLLYLVINIAFNISLLNLVKISSAVVSSLAAMASGLLAPPHPLSLTLLNRVKLPMWVVLFKSMHTPIDNGIELDNANSIMKFYLCADKDYRHGDS